MSCKYYFDSSLAWTKQLKKFTSTLYLMNLLPKPLNKKQSDTFTYLKIVSGIKKFFIHYPLTAIHTTENNFKGYKL